MGGKHPIGVLGLGLMGRPIVANLARSVQVAAWNRRVVPIPDGVELVESPRVLGRRCDTVLSLLPDLVQLEPLLEGLLAPGSSVTTLVVMSTVSPVGVRELAARMVARGVVVVDAPMSGGVSGAEAGTLAIMVGGPEAVVAELRDVLDRIGSRVTWLGPVGAGSVAKACNQVVVAGTLTALAEAMNIADEAGLRREQVLGILGSGLAASEVLEQKRQAFIARDVTPSGPAKYLAKDLAFAAESVEGTLGQLPLLSRLQEIFAELVAHGEGDLDSVVVERSVQRLAARAGTKRDRA